MRSLILSLAASLLVPVAVHAAPNERIVLTTQNTVVFRGTVDGGSITVAQMELVKLVKARGQAKYPIYLVLDSGGGSIIAGDAFIQFAKTIQNLETISIFAASMASGIVEALPGRRLITANGMMMFHRAKGQFEGQFEEGEVESQLALWKTVVRNMEQVNADRMSLPLAEYKAKVVNEYWLYGKQAVTEKVADAVIDIACTAPLIESRTTILVRSFFGSATLNFSGCPLFRAPVGVEQEEEERE